MCAHIDNGRTGGGIYTVEYVVIVKVTWFLAYQSKGGMHLYVGSVPIRQLNKQVRSSKSTNAHKP